MWYNMGRKAHGTTHINHSIGKEETIMANKNLHKNYPLTEIVYYNDFREMLNASAEKFGDRAAFKFKEGNDIREVSYKEFNRKTDELGTALCALGLGKSHIAIVGENCYPWVHCYLTVLKSEGVFVPVDKELPANEIAHIIDNADAEAVIFTGKYEEKVRSIMGALPKVKFYIGIDLDRESETETIRSYRELVRVGGAMLAGGDLTYMKMEPKHEDLKLLVYTSGTTGTAKGVMLSLHNLISCEYYGQTVSNFYDVALSVLPYHHTYEAVCGLLVGLHFGATACINENLRTVVRNFKVYQPEIVMLVPLFVESMYKKIWNEIDAKGKTELFKKMMKFSNAMLKVGIDLRRVLFKSIHDVFGGKLQKMVCGGAPIRQELGDFFDTIGITLINGYGITECSPLVSVNRDYFYDFASVGVNLPCVTIRIDSPNEDGEGEICVKGDTVMMGYYKMPELTAEVLEADGWFHTGDYGKTDSEGRLYITGRKKNLIVLKNGKNIYPEEIEEYIGNIKSVAEVIVSAQRNEDGEEVGLHAEIYPDEKQNEGLTQEQILEKIKGEISAMNDKLPPHKAVHHVTLRTEPFEKTTSGKIRRKYN